VQPGATRVNVFKAILKGKVLNTFGI